MATEGDDKPKQEFRLFGNKFSRAEEKSDGTEKPTFDISKMLVENFFSVADLSNPDVAQMVGTGGAAGFCAGYACKKIGKAVAVVFGGLFLGFQMAAQQGYLTVNWKKIEKDVAQGLDIPYNDGLEIDQQEMQSRALKYIDSLGKHGGFATGTFVTSFLVGFKIG